jgi:hypothetical protein
MCQLGSLARKLAVSGLHLERALSLKPGLVTRRLQAEDAIAGSAQDSPEKGPRAAVFKRSYSEPELCQLDGSNDLSLSGPETLSRGNGRGAAAPMASVSLMKRSHSDTELDRARQSQDESSSDAEGAPPASASNAQEQAQNLSGKGKGSLRAFKKQFKSFRVSISEGLEQLKRTISDPKDNPGAELPAGRRRSRDWRHEVNSDTIQREQSRREQEWEKARVRKSFIHTVFRSLNHTVFRSS